jgi:hypothetical protein
MGDPGTVAAMGAPGSDPLRHDLAREVRDEVLAREPIDDDERRSIERFAAEVDRLVAAGLDPFDIDADAVHITGSAIVIGERGVVLLRHRRLDMWITSTFATSSAPPISIQPQPKGRAPMSPGSTGPLQSNEPMTLGWPHCFGISTLADRAGCQYRTYVRYWCGGIHQPGVDMERARGPSLWSCRP